MESLWLPKRNVPEAARALLQGVVAVRVSLPGIDRLSQSIMGKMRDAVRSFQEFPPELKKQYMILRPPFDTEEKADDGWIIRHGTEDQNSRLKDNKIYFHYRPQLSTWLKERELKSDWFRFLLPQVNLLHSLAWRLTWELGEALAFYSGCPQVRECLLRERNEFVVRVLHYLAPGKEGCLGNVHCDKAFVTLQLGQSVDGLVLVDPVSGKEGLVTSIPDTIVVFFGQQVRHLIGDQAPKAKPIPHYIIDVDPNRGGKDGRRNGIVSFAHGLSAEEVIKL